MSKCPGYKKGLPFQILTLYVHYNLRCCVIGSAAFKDLWVKKPFSPLFVILKEGKPCSTK